MCVCVCVCVCVCGGGGGGGWRCAPYADCVLSSFPGHRRNGLGTCAPVQIVLPLPGNEAN